MVGASTGQLRSDRALINPTQPTDVPPQHRLDLFLLKSALDDQPLTTIHSSVRTQLSEQELDDMIRLSVHPLANFADIGKDGLLVAFSVDGRRYDGVALPATCREVWILCSESLDDTAEELRQKSLHVSENSLSAHPIMLTSE